MDFTNIKYLQEMIYKLPKGNITFKNINGKKYPYLQWTENGKQFTRIIKAEEFEELQMKINYRKELENKIQDFKLEKKSLDILHRDYYSNIKVGDDLISFVEPIKKYKKRECYNKLYEYVYGDSTDRVFILYGLRRTGKTTLMRQSILEMSEEMRSKTAFIQINKNITLDQINFDLKKLVKSGYKYLFIDEVTLMDDFIESASLFSDIYATSGIKIVLSGTDSLGFLFSEDYELYDRCFMLHTTFVPYREFENVLGIKGIDEYIRYGGTMSLGGIDYNYSGMTFATEKSTYEYVDSAIATNIQHSLKNYQNGTHFRNLLDLYEAKELTSVINRIVEDINHRFTLDVLTKEFISNDLNLSAKNLVKDKNKSNDILYKIDKEKVTTRLKELLEIKNKEEQTVTITNEHRLEIKEYLELLDLIVELDVVYTTDFNKKHKHIALSQPGMRYSQAEGLIKSLLKDQVFSMLSLEERNEVLNRILNDVRGRIMEEVVMIETKFSNPSCEVFKLVFARGEIDMVVFDPNTLTCSIYEIKHSDKQVQEQYKHLIDEEKCQQTQFRYGKIKKKIVLYRGENVDLDNGIQYRNLEEYLLKL